MTPKEHAQELIEKFREYSHTDFNYTRGGYQVDTQIKNAKQCALIAVNEFLDMSRVMGCKNCCPNAEYWQDVKTEIESL